MSTPRWMRVAADAGRLVGAPEKRTVDSMIGQDDALRSRLAISRRVGIFSLDGGAGATTVACSMASVLARRRQAPVLIIDGSRSADVTRMLGMRQRSECERIRVLSPPSVGVMSVSGWDTCIRTVGRMYEVVIGDWGCRTNLNEFTEVAYDCHVLVLVCRPDRFSIEDALWAARSLGEKCLVICNDSSGGGVAAMSRGTRIHTLPYSSAIMRKSTPEYAWRSALTKVVVDVMDIMGGPGTDEGPKLTAKRAL